MSFMSDYRAALKKLKEQEENTQKSKTTASKTSSQGSFMDEYRAEKERLIAQKQEEEDIAPVITVGSLSKKDEEEEAPWYKSGLFADGYDFGDVSKTILGLGEDKASLLDLTWHSAERGFYNARYGEETYKSMTGQKNQKEAFEAILAEEKYDFTPGNTVAEGVSGAFEQLGQMARQWTHPRTLAGTAGAVGAVALAGQAGPQVLVPEEVITVPGAIIAGMKAGSALSNYEIEAGHAYNELIEAGISEETAKKVAIGVGGVNAGLELLQLDELVDAYKVLDKTGTADTAIKRIAKELLNRGFDVATETVQEVAQEGVTITGTQLASKHEKGEWAYNADEVTERLGDTAKASALTFGMLNAPATVKNTVSIARDQKATTSLTDTEKAVVKKEVENRIAESEKDGNKLTAKEKNKLYDSVVRDMEKGIISTDTIEEVLGGESYNTFKSEMDGFFEGETFKSYKEALVSEDAEIKKLESQLKELEPEPNTVGNSKKYDAIQSQIDELKNNPKSKGLKSILDQEAVRINGIKNQLRDEVSGLVKDSRLAESYRELARKNEKFTVDLNQYENENAKKTMQNLMDSGLGDNTRQFHEFADFLARLSADKGTTFTMTNDEQLAKTEYWQEGAKVNAFINENGDIVLNKSSDRALNASVGHEITHVLESSKELYGELSEVIKNYAISKEGLDGYNKRIQTAERLYQGKKNTTAEKEVVADLVGEYLFTDSEFIHRLSTENRNVFQKIYDEIKYLCKIVTAGSKEARELEKVKKAFEDAYRADNKAEGGTKYSVSDTDGKQLTKEQQDFFKDSKMRDENGNLKVMYHGTPNGDFTVFKDGTYFTDNKEYADRYQNPGASSISSGKTASNPKTFEVYLDIKKPFDINDAEARRIYIEEYIKGGNAIGINPYLSDAEYDKINSIDWTEGEDLREFLIDNEYDYDGLVLDEGGTGGYGDDVQSRGTSYVVFSPEQVKSIDNTKPTADKDIRFSLSETVEETKDLIAVHNLHTAELLETLKLSGLPSPSVAIIKAKDGHEKYGDVSLILPKDAIDPQTNKANRIYGSDAWTPTRSNAQVEYEVDYDIQRQFERTIEALSKNVANGVFSKSSVLGMAGIEDSTGLNLNEIAKKMSAYDAVQAAYVAENGGNVEIVYRTKVFDNYGNDALKGYVDKVGEQEVARLTVKMMTGERLTAEEIETAKDSMMETWISKHEYTLKRKPELREGRIAKYRENISDIRVEDFVKHAWEFYEDSGATTDEIDRLATGDNLRAAANRADVETWVAEKLQGLLSDPGIYNGKDLFTPSGKRRSFKETHWEYTAENIVRAMNNADARGANVWNVSGEAIIATATSEYKNIDEVRADKDRLFKAEDGYYEQIKDGISEELQTVTKDIIRTTEHISDNQYDEEQIIGRVIMEAAQGTKTVASVKRVFQKNGYRIGDAQAKSVLSLFDHASKVPTGYFEAKPQRVVGFDEVGVYVIPNNADVKLKQELLNRGYAIAEYDPNIEGHRQQVVNQFEEYKFSLSEAGEQPRRYGDYNIYGKDIGVNDPLAEFAPESEEVAKNSTQNSTNATQNSTRNSTVAENSTVSKTESVAPVTISEKETTTPVTPEEMRELFPDDLAPNELDALVQEKENLENRMLEMGNTEDFTDFETVNERYTQVLDRIAELESVEAERVGSLTDADIPPEREAVRGYKAVTAEDPFADRSETAVGNRSVKAYQYENPEVKPFFREAAYALAEDINLSIPAERWYNDDLYYSSGGEQGFGGNSRLTAKDVGDFKDQWKCSWDDLKEAVNDIIEDHGKENNALSKRVEFLINDRLMYGYTNIRGERIEPNQAYLDFLKEKQINEYSKEAREAFFANAEEYAPFDIAPVPQTTAKTKTPVSQTKVNPYDSIGAAPYGFDPITQLQYEYGNLPDGEHPVREDSMPKSTNGKDKVSLTARTVKGAGATPDEFVDLLHKETLGGRFSYIPIKNSDTVQKAYDEIVKKGWEAARGEWEAKVRRGEVSAELTATGSLLLNHAAKAGDRTAWLSVLHDYQIMGTNAGQAIQAMRILKTLTPDDSLYMIERSVEQMVEDMKLGTEIVIDENLKQAYLNAKTDGERDTARQAIAKDVARQIPSTAMDKWTALRYLNMLGNFRTQGRNIIGNLGMSVTTGARNAVATGIEWLANKASGGKFHRTKSIFLNKGQLKAARNDFENVKTVALNGGKFNDPMAKSLQFQQEVQDARKIFKFAPLEGYRRATNWAMDTGDLVFSKAAYGRALAGYLKANGIKETDFSKIDQQKLDEARAYAINEAQETTFRDNNWLSSWVSKLGRGKNTPKGVKIVSEGVMPFRKTPANILLRAEEYSPLGLVNATVKSIQAAKGNATGADVVNSWAKALTGTGLFALGMWLNNSGMLSGGPDEDDDKEWFESQYGWQNYAIQIGDKNYTIDFLSPAAMPLLMGAQLNELRQTGGVELKDLEKALLSIADPMIEMSMLQGLNDTLDNIRYAESNMGQFIVNACVSYLTQGLTNSFLGQLERSFEGQRMSTYTDKDSDLPAWLQKALGKASAKTPGWDYNQIPYIDAWGETEDIAPLPGLAENTLSPSYISQGITDAVYEELNRLNDAQSDINVYPQTPDKTVTFDDAYGNRHEDYNLSAEEYVELAQIQGQTQKELVEDILSNYQYSGLNDKEKARAVQLAYQYAKEYSRQEVLGADGFSADWMKRADAKGDIVNAIIAHTNDEKTFAYENPEKYQFFTESGISWDDYDSADEDGKREYSNMYTWVSDEDHPGRYSLAKAVSDDFQTFWQYRSDCNNFDAKDENGETVNGLKKERVIDYINSLDIDYGARLILFRSMYDGKKDKEAYDQDIVDYLNSRDDISYEDMEAILKELG